MILYHKTILVNILRPYQISSIYLETAGRMKLHILNNVLILHKNQVNQQGHEGVSYPQSHWELKLTVWVVLQQVISR